MREVSLHNISSTFNDRVCIYHLFIDNHVITHFLNSSTRLSHDSIVTSRTVHEAIDLFETFWVSQYGHPKATIADQAFTAGVLKEYATKMGNKLLLVSSRRHNKYVFESKHCVLHDIFNRTKTCTSSNNSTDQMMAQNVFRVSNNLYGNDIVS